MNVSNVQFIHLRPFLRICTQTDRGFWKKCNLCIGKKRKKDSSWKNNARNSTEHLLRKSWR